MPLVTVKAEIDNRDMLEQLIGTPEAVITLIERMLPEVLTFRNGGTTLPRWLAEDIYKALSSGDAVRER